MNEKQENTSVIELDPMVRINITMRLSTYNKVQQRIPAGERSELIVRLLEEHFKQLDEEKMDIEREK